MTRPTTRRKVHRWLHAVLCGVVLSSWVACRQPPEAPRPLRLLVEPPTAHLDPSSVFELTTVERHRLDAPSALTIWRAEKTTTSMQGTVALRGGDRISRVWQRSAGDVDVIRLEIAEWWAGTVEIFWDRGDDLPYGERRIEVRLDALRDGRWLDVDVSGHPTWRGSIESIGVQFKAPEKHRLRLRALELLARRPAPERLAEQARQPVTIELDHERRGGRVADPRHPIAWTVTPPPDGELRIGFGVEAGLDAPTVLRARVVEESGDTELFVETLGPERAGRWLQTTVDLADFAGREVTIELTAEIGDPMALAFWSNPVVRARHGRRPPNIVFISLDTLRADHLPFYGYARDTAPHLAAWAESAVVFEQAVAPSPWTLPSHLSMFTGLDPFEHGVHDPMTVSDHVVTLAEMLRAQGYTTVAITGGGFLDPAFGLGQGFDRYRYWPEPPGPATDDELRTGVSRALEWLREDRQAPWFLFLHSYETHAPYRPRQPYFERFHGGVFEHAIGYANRSSSSAGYQRIKEPVLHRRGQPESPLPPDQIPTLIDLYDSGIAYADHQIGRLLDVLEHSGRDRDTLVVLTSDHGEALGEKGLAGHFTNDDFNLMVPLVVRLPDGRHGGTRVEQQVSTAQLPATLLDLVGLPPYPGLRGPSLRPAVEGRPQASRQLAWSYAANSNHGVSLRVDNRWKLIYQNSAFGPIATRRELYDLQADPSESTDLSSTAPPALDGLGRWIADKLETRLVGARIALINRSAAPLRGWMRGDSLAVTRIKLPWTDKAPSLTWDETEVACRFEVAPGDTVHLEVEPWADPFFELGIEQVGGALVFDAAVEAVPGVWAIGFDGATWHRLAADAAGDARQEIRVTWADQATVGRDPSLDDDELRRQLEALGYIQ